jgi:hypothetical protein
MPIQEVLTKLGPSVLLHRYSLEHGIIDVPKLVHNQNDRLPFSGKMIVHRVKSLTSH